MLLRRLVAALCPPLLCLALCALFNALDGVMPASFFTYLIKGLPLGACLALIPPLAGVKSRLLGLSVWLFLGAGLIVIALVLQYLQSVGVLAWQPLPVTVNGQTVLVESAVLGYMLATCAVCRGR